MNEDNKKSILSIIKSNYILKQLLDYLHPKKYLNLIRYNKFIQNKLNKILMITSKMQK